jgi:hypothetical protein
MAMKNKNSMELVWRYVLSHEDFKIFQKTGEVPPAIFELLSREQYEHYLAKGVLPITFVLFAASNASDLASARSYEAAKLTDMAREIALRQAMRDKICGSEIDDEPPARPTVLSWSKASN